MSSLTVCHVHSYQFMLTFTCSGLNTSLTAPPFHLRSNRPHLPSSTTQIRAIHFPSSRKPTTLLYSTIPRAQCLPVRPSVLLAYLSLRSQYRPPSQVSPTGEFQNPKHCGSLWFTFSPPDQHQNSYLSDT